MFHSAYEEMVRFASEGSLANELKHAKSEYVQRTGELFESDETFERRISSFLEWYVLDRAVSFAPTQTPATLYIETIAATRDAAELEKLWSFAKSVLSLFEYRRRKGDKIVVHDLLSNRKLEVYEQRVPLGLEPKDIFEARLILWDGRLLFSDAFTFHPRSARRVIMKAASRYRRSTDADMQMRIDLVHRVAFYSNRCERYRHVDPKRIFLDLLRAS